MHKRRSIYQLRNEYWKIWYFNNRNISTGGLRLSTKIQYDKKCIAKIFIFLNILYKYSIRCTQTTARSHFSKICIHFHMPAMVKKETVRFSQFLSLDTHANRCLFAHIMKLYVVMQTFMIIDAPLITIFDARVLFSLRGAHLSALPLDVMTVAPSIFHTFFINFPITFPPLPLPSHSLTFQQSYPAMCIYNAWRLLKLDIFLKYSQIGLLMYHSTFEQRIAMLRRTTLYIYNCINLVNQNNKFYCNLDPPLIWKFL